MAGQTLCTSSINAARRTPSTENAAVANLRSESASSGGAPVLHTMTLCQSLSLPVTLAYTLSLATCRLLHSLHQSNALVHTICITDFNISPSFAKAVSRRSLLLCAHFGDPLQTITQTYLNTQKRMKKHEYSCIGHLPSLVRAEHA